MESGDWARRAVDAAAEGIWVVDIDGVIVDVNPAGARLLAREQAELVGTSVGALLDDDGRQQYREHLDDLRAGRVNPSAVEVLLHRPDGTGVWTLVHEGVLTADDGTIEGFVWSVSDNRARHELIEGLRRSEELRAEAERIARLGSFRWDATGQRYQLSEGVRALYGRRTDEMFVSLQTYLQHVHPEDRGRVQGSLDAAVDVDTPFDFEARVLTDQGYRWMRVQGVVERGDDGQLLAATGTHQDVTRQHETDEELHHLVRMNTLMKSVASAANEAATLADLLVRAKSFVVVHDDRDRARAHVLDEDGELVTLHVDEADEAADADPRLALVVARERTTAKRCVAEKRALWDGEVGLTLAFPVVVDDEVVVVITITSQPPLTYRRDRIVDMVRQIADQLARVAQREKAARAVAEARDNAIEASRHKSEFLATMSHEIRTPLNGIVGLGELLGRTELDDQQRHLVSGIDLSSRALLAIINDILDFSKIESGHLELETVDFEIRGVLDRVAAVLADGARAQGLELLVSCSPDVPALASGDPTRLAQVLTNLGSNAVKFTQQGLVRIRATLADVRPGGDPTIPEGGVRLRIQVSDTGIGIDPRRAASIFQAFAQEDTSTTRRFGGTGLGLAISREIVEASGGEIGVSSIPGAGSTFWFEVPLGPPLSSELAEPLARDRERLSGLHALVVDDLATNRHILTEQLGWWGVTAHAVGDAGAAVRALGEQHFDIVLLDMAMPDVDGLMLADLLHTQPVDSPVPMVMLTSSLPLESSTLVAHGIRECLTKPISSAALRDLLLRTIGTGEWERPAPAEVPRRPERVLVVEDNHVNQVVATSFLDAFGYDADTAGDGVEALEKLAEQTYALVLMDVQMPRLDGYATTRAIREREAEQGLPRLPVVAMTATAVEGERQRALDAGMDDFLTKPVSGSRLAEAVARWVDAGAVPDAVANEVPGAPASGATAEPSAAPGPPADADVLDRERIEDLLDLSPDGGYLRQAVTGFTDHAGVMLAEVRAAVDGADADRLATAAHSLKGAASNIGLVRVAASAHDLERAGRDGDTDVSAGLDLLVSALDQAAPALERLLGSLPR